VAICGGSGAKSSDSRSNCCSDKLHRVSAERYSATAAMNNDTLLPFELPSVHRKKLTADFEEEGGKGAADKAESLRV
jgi:hypothetical protein